MIPAPGLAQLPELVGRFHDSGVDTRLSVDPGCSCRVIWTSRRTGSSRKPSPTPQARRPCAATVAVERVNGSMIIEVSTPDLASAKPIPTAEVSSASPSGSRCAAACSSTATASTAASASGRPPVAMTVRVLLADDDALIRAGLAVVLGTAGDLEVVAEAADGIEAVDLCLRHTPDVVLMDVRMPGIDGIEATRRLVAS